VSAVRRLPGVLVALALAAVVLTGCGGDEGGGNGADAAPVTGVTEVAAKDNQFTPPAIQVTAGTAVTWTFDDRFVPHDVTGDGFTSGDPRRSGTFTHTFDRPGTYPYRCTLHDGMVGRVVVSGAA
jgi:plastocyanin